MDFTNIKDDRYYCFGTNFFKDGSIDYKALASELDEAQFYYAAMAFECDDVGFFIRLKTYSPAKWLFEGDEYDVTQEDFEKFIQTKQFKKFIEVVPQKVQTAIGALQNVDEEQMKANGVSKDEIEKITRNSLRIMTIVKAGCKKPVMA